MLFVYVVWRKEEFVGLKLVKIFKRETIAQKYADALQAKNDQSDISYVVEYQNVA